MLYDYFDRERYADIDLILSAGDLRPRFLSFLVSMLNKPCYYVKGNHDTIYSSEPPLGCEDIDFFGWDQVPDHFIQPVKDGIIVAFVYQDPYGKAAAAIEVALMALRGEEVERYMDWPIKIVTKHNIKDYID